jgi:outer membrane receptor protein involved in Fe transport
MTRPRKSSLQTALTALALLAAALLLPPPGAAWAQQAATATVEGVVTDPQGAVVPNVKITVTSNETGLTREAATDESGVYRVPLLPPGTYKLAAQGSGFAPLNADNIRLTVGQKLNLDLSLSVTVGETVNITDAAPVVETSRTQVSGAVNERAIRELPVNGRNFLDFVTLTPGVVRDPRGGDLSFGGQRGTLNSVQIDGVDNNNNFFGQSLGRTGSGRAPYQFSQDAVQEFQVNTNSFSAEFGRAAGGVINVVTKSGTNEFHGTAFEFYRDRGLNARNLNYNATSNTFTPLNPKQPYHFHQFGGTIGGPIRKDRAFFFFTYDGQRNTTPNIVNPLVAAVAGTTPAALLSQAGRADLFPLSGSYARRFNQDVYLGKADFQLDPANRLSVRYNHQNFTGANLENGGPTRAQENSGNSLVKTRTFSTTLNTVFSSRLLNEFRAQVVRDQEPGTANSDRPEAEVRQSGQTFFVGRNSFSPRETTERKYQFVNNLSYVAGAHSLKGGADIIVEKIKNFFPGQFGAQYLFNSYELYAANKLNGVRQGTVARFTQAFQTPGTTGPLTNPDFNEFGFFLQDDWRATNNLTLNFGVRYDIQKIRQPEVTNPGLLAASGINTGVIPNDYNNVAPRFGFAWKPTASDRFVVRGGYGLFYGRTPAIAIATATSNNGLNVLIVTLNNPTLPFAYPNRFRDLNDFRAAGFGLPITNVFYFDKDYVQPYTQQGSFGLEFGLTNDISVSASYLHVKGTHLQRTRDINLPAPVAVTTATGSAAQATFLRYPGPQGNPTRPFAAFGRVSQFESNANSNYNALVLELNKRFSRSFQFQASYTWSKVIDTVPDATGVVAFVDDFKFVQYPTAPGLDRGLGDADVPHRFVANGVWDINYARGLSRPARLLLDGWQLSGIVQASSNRPYSVGLVADLNNDTNSNTDRAPGYGRNTERGEKIVTVDARAAKTFFLTERFQLQLIGEAFNLFNRVNYTGYNRTLYNVGGTLPTAVTLTPRPDFGFPRAAADQRIGQLALRLIF